MYQLDEINKYVLLAILLAMTSGAILGLILQFIKDIFSKLKSQPQINTNLKIKSYAHASFMFSIPMGIIAFNSLIFNTNTPIKNVVKYVIPCSIIGIMIGLGVQLLEYFSYKKNN